MPQNVLIAALGEHPAVVTGMVKALREIAGIKIDILCVLYSQDTGRKYIDGIGTGQIEDFLRGQCEVHSVPLPFSDPNTRETSIQFLQALAGLLEQYRDAAQHGVYLSLAGGRKNTSALMALITQFFPAVQGLYHLLDKREGQPGAVFHTIEQMETMTKAEQLAVLDPPLEQLNLIPVPYPGAFADSVALWQYLKTDPAHWDNLLPVALTPEAEDFFRQVAGSKLPEPRLQVKITSQAMQDYEKLGAELQGKFIGYAQRMQYPLHLEAKMSGPRGWETDCEVYPEHKAHSNLRLLYYWDRGAQTVTIVRVMLHDEYDRGGEMWRDNSCESNPISALKREYLLLVPLGQSPMVVTQTYHSSVKALPKAARRSRWLRLSTLNSMGVLGRGCACSSSNFNSKKWISWRIPFAGDGMWIPRMPAKPIWTHCWLPLRTYNRNIPTGTLRSRFPAGAKG